MIKRMICSLLVVISITTIMPIRIYAKWKQNNVGWWYVEGNSYSTGWKQIDGLWYYFGNDGYMKTGWILDQAWWYYLRKNGSMATGKVSIESKEYEFDSNGKWINNGLPNRTENSNISIPPSEEKISTINNFNWFSEDGNTYFKVEDNYYIKGIWNIDGNVYVFDENGVLQKGEYTSQSGKKYKLGDNGEVIKCLSNESYKIYPEYAITTKSGTKNYVVKLDDSCMMNITDINSLDKTQFKATVKDKTLYCKTNQIIDLGNIKVTGTDTALSSLPNLIIMSYSTDQNIAAAGISLNLENGFFRNIHPTVIGYKAGSTTITIYVNGVETSFNVVVTE